DGVVTDADAGDDAELAPGVELLAAEGGDPKRHAVDRRVLPEKRHKIRAGNGVGKFQRLNVAAFPEECPARGRHRSGDQQLLLVGRHVHSSNPLNAALTYASVRRTG